MKIPLIGPSYTLQSVVAAAQQCMNFYPETIQQADEARRQVFFGRPGLSLFSSLVPIKIRGMWAGGGRLFVVHGNTVSEVLSTGAATPRAGNVAELGTDPDPAQIFSNGHQLMIVAGQRVYYDNGGVGGVVPAQMALGGIGNTATATTSLNYVSGDAFVAGWVGKPIKISGRDYMITGLITTPSPMLQITPAPPNETGARYLIAQGAVLDGVTGGFLDGYGIVNRVPTPNVAGDPGRNFNISALNDFTIWDPLMFGVKEGHSDYINSILCDHEELWLQGTETIEIWTNTGNADFPFQRIPGAYIHEGSVATYAPASVGPYTCWLGGGPNGQTVAYRAVAFQPERISTHAQEDDWNAPGFKVSDAVSYPCLDAGHLFWVINFWQQQQTWVYDMSENAWHERAGWNPTPAPGNFIRYQPWFHQFIPEWGPGGKHIVGNPSTGKLYEMGLNYYSDDGVAIQHLRAFPHLLNEDKNLFHHRFELFLETGALTAGDPPLYVGLDWSDDRGHNFAHPRILQTTGAPGEYSKRIVWRRLGKSRDRVYRVGVLGMTKVALTDAFLEATAGEW